MLVGDLYLLLMGVIMLMGIKVVLSAERRLPLDGDDGMIRCWESIYVCKCSRIDCSHWWIGGTHTLVSVSAKRR